MLELFRVAASMVLDRSEYDRDVSEVDKSGKNLAENLSGYFEKAKKVLTGVLSAVAIQKVASGIWNLAKETSAAGDRIDKTSQALGMSRKAFQEWDYILAQSGASIDSMGMSMKTMNEAISKNSAETAVALSRLGLSAAKLQNLSPEQQFEELVKAFQKMPASAKKSEYAMLLFGRNAQSLMPLLNSASGSVDELRNRAHELGLIMSDEDVNASVAFGDALDDLNRVWTAVKQKFGAQMLPTLTRGLVNVANSLGRVTNSVAKAFKSGDWSGVFDTITTEVKALLPKFIDTVVNLGVSLFQNADKIISLGFSIITGITAGLREHIPELVEKIPTIFKSMVDGIKELGTEAGNGIIDFINAVFGTKIPRLNKIEWPSWADVEKAFDDAWEKIKTEAGNKMKLIFGTTEDGAIKWPEWSDVSSSFDTAWKTIKEKASALMKLVFGETDDGGIDFNNGILVWSKIRGKFVTFWNEIKEHAANRLKLIFGETEEGGIEFAYPLLVWVRIKQKFIDFWNSIKEKAVVFMKLVFGEDNEGGISWGSAIFVWEKVRDKFIELWDGIKGYAKNYMKLLFGETENGGINWGSATGAWGKAKDKFIEFWNGIKGFAVKQMKLVFGETEDGGIDFKNATLVWGVIKTKFETFWDNIKKFAKPKLKIIFGESDNGDIDFKNAAVVWNKIRKKFSDFWGEIKGYAKNIFKLVFGEDDDGGIKWPDASTLWPKLESKLTEMWGGIQEKAKGVLKLVFGEDENGDAAVPEGLTDFFGTIQSLLNWVLEHSTAANAFNYIVDNIETFIQAAGEVGTEIFTTVQSVFSWIVDNAESVIEALGEVGPAVGNAITLSKIIEFVSALGTSSKIGLIVALLVTLVNAIQSTDWNGIGEGATTLQEFFGDIGNHVNDLELVKGAMRGIAAGIIASVVAAHPYISALAAIVALLTYIRSQGGPEEMLTKNLFSGFSKENLNVLQEYIDAYNQYNSTVQQLDAMYWEGKEGTDEYKKLEQTIDALDKKRLELYDKVKQIHTEDGKDLLSAYETWYHDQVGSGSGVLFDVPINLMMDDEQLRKDVKKLDFSAKVKLFPDTSALNGFLDSGYSYQFGYAKGLNYVPQNGLYMLHQGETILNQDQGRDWRQNNSGGFNAQQLYATVASAVAAAVGDIQINMNGKAVANAVSGQVSRNLYQDALGRRYAPV